MPKLFSSIVAKLIVLAVLNGVAFVTIALVANGGFSRVETLATETVSDEMAQMLNGARLSRDISSIYIEIDRISQSCHTNRYNQAKNRLFRSSLEDISGRIKIHDLRDTFSHFNVTALLILDRCDSLNQSLKILRNIDGVIAQEIDRLEQRVGENLINETLKGRSTSHLDQLMVLAAGLRETHLQLGKQIAEQESYVARNGDQGPITVELLEDMVLRLQTVIAVTAEIGQIRFNLEQKLLQYRSDLIRYQLAYAELVEALDSAREIRLSLLQAIQHLENAAYERASSVQNTIGSIVQNSSFQVLGLSLFISLVTLFLIDWLNRRHIKYPLGNTLGLIASIRNGKVPDRPKNVPDNEWGIIQNSLLAMAEQLENSRIELMASRERLEMALEGANDGLWDWNLDTNEIYYSPRWKSMLGYEEHELKPTLATWKALVDPNQRELSLQLVEEYLQGKTAAFVTEFRMLHKEGHWVDILSRAQLARDPRGQITSPKRLVGTHTDISERKRAEAKLQQSEQEQRSLIAALPDIIMRFDDQCRFLFVSENINSASFLSADKFMGKSPKELGFPEQLCVVWEDAIYSTFRNGVSNETEFILEGPMGRKIFNWKLTPDLDNRGNVRSVLAVARDVSLLKEQQQRLTRIAHYDVLTGLPNRLLLADRMQQAMSQVLRRNDKLAVIYIDLDGFKGINDKYGHDVGDKLLEIVSERMQECLREGDTLARLGGDEFAAVFLDLPDISACEPLLRRLLKAAAKDIRLNGVILKVTASLGVTFYPQEKESDADQLLRQADQAMYQAKLSGKNRYHLFDLMQDQAIRGLHASLKRIKQGIRDKEFLLHYQPKVNMFSGEVIGLEALIRWQQPDQPLLYPASFLPLVEDHLLGIELGNLVLQQALKQLTAWKLLGLTLPVSVNVSAQQLLQTGFAAELRKMLKAFPMLSPGQLELEILETSALNDIELVSKVLEECKQLGVRVAIDDFGTGYSSLSYLKNLSVDTLKVDQSFVRDMLSDPDDLSILEGVMGLARAFRLNVIAEGVETEAHGNMLLDLGYEIAQGYAIARPMAADRVPEWIEKWRAPRSWLERTAPSLEGIQLRIAAIEHQAWVAQVHAAVDGDTPFPALDPTECRFGIWLHSEMVDSLFNDEQKNQLHKLHNQIHQCAEKLESYKDQGLQEQLKEELNSLDELKLRLLALLRQLIQEDQQLF